MQSAALAEAIERGHTPFPLLKVVWVARGLSLGTDICAPAGRLTDVGQVTRASRPGGWGEIRYGSGVKKGELRAVETTVDVADLDQSLIRMLDTYDPRGSAANIYGAAPGLVEADLEPLFTGIVADWSSEGTYTRLFLKVDDAVLRTPVPSPVFKRTEWGSAADGTIFSTHMPLVLGIHDAYLITARGMVPAVNIRYDKDVGYWWLASVGYLKAIRRIHYDGTPQEGGEDVWWRVRREVVGQNRLTIIEIDEGYQPDPGVVVAFDCEGPDANGLATGAALVSPVEQLRAILQEYIYRDPPLGAWRGDHPIIDDASWDAASALFTAHGHDSARRFGADQGEESGAEVVQSKLNDFPWTRIDWTPRGTLAFTVIDFDDVDPDDTLWLDLEAHHDGLEVPYAPGDRREVYTQVVVPYMFSAQEQKSLSGYEAHDVAALPEKVVLTIECAWSQGRFTQE